MVIIRKDGSMIKAIEVNPLTAVEKWQEMCSKVEKVSITNS
jgi:hypothetical protein